MVMGRHSNHQSKENENTENKKENTDLHSSSSSASTSHTSHEKKKHDDLLESAITQNYKNLGRLFEQMMASLPENLCDFYQWFVPLPISQEYQNYLRSHFSVQYGGPYARHLLKFGMTPETVLGATRSLELLLQDCEASAPPDSQTIYHANYSQLSILLHVDDNKNKNTENDTHPEQVEKTIFIPQEHIVPYIAMTPLLPRDKALHFSFIVWFWEVLSYCPHLIHGYSVEHKENNCLHFRKNTH
jgi:hypothetical protein